MPPKAVLKHKHKKKRPRKRQARKEETDITYHPRIGVMTPEEQRRFLSSMLRYRAHKTVRSKAKFLAARKDREDIKILKDFLSGLSGRAPEDRELALDFLEYDLHLRLATRFYRRLLSAFEHGRMPLKHRHLFGRATFALTRMG
jgi:hypothetical protein